MSNNYFRVLNCFFNQYGGSRKLKKGSTCIWNYYYKNKQIFTQVNSNTGRGYIHINKLEKWKIPHKHFDQSTIRGSENQRGYQIDEINPNNFVNLLNDLMKHLYMSHPPDEDHISDQEWWCHLDSRR